ncbi:acetoin dehydrogenase E2 subunit dihydrolipoyllysine-residue acetyltransferase (plasmid) [Variovorax sp. SRS16]|uniref:alpha/beta fold hydrolase n=1 Tax=Variovorax sp. SRS16 TaxID=282217 RepID=UPI001316B448|nr:alpha/beta hydrolase [Variovorax sp. SRS16]VTU45477.1 acetoin dehydrogenase E2 subunit dihydrolipoyllysine-residue acetyltransferase [Variovorax sp. SRS16]
MQNLLAPLADCEIRYLVGGQGPSLLCLHPASGVRITPALEELMQSFTLYLPTLPGFDGTAPPRVAAMVPLLGCWIGEFIDTVIGAPVRVAGHSFGGWVASWLAVQRPALVESLVLQCPAGFWPRGMPRPAADPATQLARTYAHPERRRAETKSDEVIAANRRLAVEYGAGLACDDALVARLAQLELPVLLLHGRQDGIVPMESARLVQAAIPHARLVWVDDAAHNIEVDQPHVYTRLVKQFLLADARPA